LEGVEAEKHLEDTGGPGVKKKVDFVNKKIL
jgi:hypothetical protein